MTVEDVDLRSVEKMVLEKYDADPENLIHILQDVNATYRYLPAPALEQVAESLGIPLSKVYSVVTFYKALSLEPRGEHQVTVCLGTACHVKGGQRLVEKLERDLGVCAGATTEDGKFTLETVNCLGCCALGPVMVVDDTYHGNLNSAKADKVMKRYG